MSLSSSSPSTHAIVTASPDKASADILYDDIWDMIIGHLIAEGDARSLMAMCCTSNRFHAIVQNRFKTHTICHKYRQLLQMEWIGPSATPYFPRVPHVSENWMWQRRGFMFDFVYTVQDREIRCHASAIHSSHVVSFKGVGLTCCCVISNIDAVTTTVLTVDATFDPVKMESTRTHCKYPCATSTGGLLRALCTAPHLLHSSEYMGLQKGPKDVQVHRVLAHKSNDRIRGIAENDGIIACLIHKTHGQTWVYLYDMKSERMLKKTKLPTDVTSIGMTDNAFIVSRGVPSHMDLSCLDCFSVQSWVYA